MGVFEIKTYDNSRKLNYNSNDLDSSLISIISKAMKVDKKSIKDISALKKGMTNKSFKFTSDDEKYIIRIPGKGTDKLINRKNEYEVYSAIKGSGISDDVIYISPDNGYKISRFIEGSRTCDPNNKRDVKLCIGKLKKLHKKNLKVSHKFDLYETLDYYEKLRKGGKSTYPDYLDTKKKIKRLKPIIKSSPRDFILSHIDPVPDNFLLADGDVRLIDWEYSGMQDPHVDIAMFAIYSKYDKKAIDKLIDIYFENKCQDIVRIKIYSYIAVCGLLWSNWCEYKNLFGVEFGEYGKRHYRYAKEYYELVKRELAEGENRI